MKLLAIDTTEDGCSAALSIDGDVRERFELAPRRHSELILPMMDQLLADAALRVVDLDALAFARGPGAFTGLRIAASIIQGAAFAADRPVVPVSSLQALAQGCAMQHGDQTVISALDARMGEVYVGAFAADAGGCMRPVVSETVCAPGAVSVSGDGWTGAGSGWQAYVDVLSTRCDVVQVRPQAIVTAAAVAALGVTLFGEGHAVDAEQALPVYLRDQVAWAKA